MPKKSTTSIKYLLEFGPHKYRDEHYNMSELPNCVS